MLFFPFPRLYYIYLSPYVLMRPHDPRLEIIVRSSGIKIIVRGRDRAYR
jgi:hypothetical protein